MKRPPPDALTQWRQPRLAANRGAGMECSYDELRRDAAINAVEDALFAEQGGICAYTGHSLSLQTGQQDHDRKVGFHVEHLKAQTRCRRQDDAVYGEDTDYRNMVACWPPRNCGYELPYGAQAKGEWPAPAEDHLFVSPLLPSCSKRFAFNRRGEIESTDPDDLAATQTIASLRLDHRTLTELRRAEIRGRLRDIRLNEAKRLLRQLQDESSRLNAGQPVTLDRFCFAVAQALEREIRKLEGIRRR